jgi:peptide-methionine (R)-S-oxide reductase
MNDFHKTEEEIQKQLTPEEYQVLRQGGTEAPFKGEYVNNHDTGMYVCKVCGSPLFSSETKFDSKSGWPSFTDPAVAENVGTRSDDSHGMHRTEVFCKVCGSHLGHVFNDGPKAETGNNRFCINSISLDFKPGEMPA